MIYTGYYSQTNWDNPLAPFVDAKIRAADDKWVNVSFLIDLGADGTYLPSEYLKKLGLQLNEAETKDNVNGVGGQSVEHVPFMTQLRFDNNGNHRLFDLEVGVFTEEESLDFPLLGRDVMNAFTLLCDAPANLVWLTNEADRTKFLQFCDTIETT